MVSKVPTKRLVSPKGVAIYPRLNSPDEYKGKRTFKVQLKMDLEDPQTKKFIETVTEMREAAHQWAIAELEARIENEDSGAKKGKLKKKLEGITMADSPIEPVFDEDGEETNFVTVRWKMNAEYQDRKTKKIVKLFPKFKDGKNNDIEFGALNIGGGTLMRVGGMLRAYHLDTDNKTGVSFRLEAVKVLKLVEFGGAADHDFGDEDEGEDLSTRKAPVSESEDFPDDSEDAPEPDEDPDF